MLTGYAAAFLFLLCLTAGIFLFRYAVQRMAPILVTLLEILLGLFFATLILLSHHALSFRQLFLEPTLQHWLYLGLAAATGVLGGNYFSLLNLKWGGALINSLLSPAITATVVLLSVTTTAASLTWQQATGIALTLGAVVFFLGSGKGAKQRSTHYAKALWSGLATVACISATILLSVKGGTAGSLSIVHVLWLRLLLALPMVSVFALQEKRPVHWPGAKFWLALFVGVALQTLTGSYLWFAATYRLGVPLFQTLIATLPFWVYGVEVYVLRKEKASLYFLLAAFVAAVGVGLMLL